MNGERMANHQVSTLSKIGYGIFLPDMVFVVYQLILIGSTNGTGSWDGMSIFFGSLFIVPGLLVANCWVTPIQWRRRSSVFAAGLMIPAVIGATSFLWLYGPDKIRRAIKSVQVASLLEIWLLILLFFAPLLISILYAVLMKFHDDKK